MSRSVHSQIHVSPVEPRARSEVHPPTDLQPPQAYPPRDLGPPLYRLPAAAAAAGASYRQADHWVAHGALPIAVAAGGSGTQRLLTLEQVAAMCRLVQLRALGIPLRIAADPPGKFRDLLVDEEDVKRRLLELVEQVPAAYIVDGRPRSEEAIGRA